MKPEFKKFTCPNCQTEGSVHSPTGETNYETNCFCINCSSDLVVKVNGEEVKATLVSIRIDLQKPEEEEDPPVE